MKHLNKRKKRVQIQAFVHTSKWIAEIEEFTGKPASPSMLASYATIERELQKELDKQEAKKNDKL